MDTEKAYLLFIDKNKEKFITIKSNVENYHPFGGARSKSKWGPQDVVQDSRFLERKKQQLKKYFNEIIHLIKDVNSIVIYGPADTNRKLNDEIEQHHKLLYKNIKAVKKVDSMTINQVKALLKDYFDNSSL